MTDHADHQRVRLETDGPIARIVLDAPEQHNALEAADVATFRAHLDTVDRDDRVRVLVVTGAGDRTFCAGASLAQMEDGRMSGALFETLTDAISRVRVPTICALNGSVYGGGGEIALCCDFRIGVTGSRLRVPAARLGICYPISGLRRYVRRLGLGTAQRILVATEVLDADELLRVGFLTRLVAPEALATEVDAMAERLAQLAPLAVQAMKELLNAIASGGVDDARAAELTKRCTASADMVEGFAAAKEKREPVFRGR